MLQTLLDSCAALGVPLTAAQAEQLCDFGARLLEQNRVMNLTAITEPQAVAKLHFADCLALLRIVPFSGKRVIDVGCGAGFPGVPLKLGEPSLGELARMGVASLKLEGRMKRPEYVAIVTGIYRAALDGREVRSSDLSALRAAFSREGFTEGYYLGRTGPQMFGTRQPERPDRELLAAARATYENLEPQRVPVDFYAIVAHGQNAMLAVQDADGHICQTQGAVPQDAERRALTQDELAARLSKTGGTPYAARSVRSVVDPGLTLPASEINRMRREVLAHLSAVRARRPAPQLLSYRALPPVLGTRVVLTDGEELVTAAPAALLEAVPDGVFLRCHQSYWANFSHITAMEKDEFVLTGGLRVPISRSYRSAARSAFFANLRGEEG